MPKTPLKLDVFGRRVLIERRVEQWVVYYVDGDGKRRIAEDISIPDSVLEGELERYVADLCHEWATPRHPAVARVAE